MFAFLRRIFSWLPTSLVLVGLVALGWWGWKTDWEINRMLPWLVRTSEGGRKEAREAKEPENPASQPGPIVLDSGEAADQAGIDSDTVRRQSVTRIVEAPAVLAFDQTRYAQIASRASGNVWRVLGRVGDSVKKGDILALVAAPEVGKAKADFLSAFVQTEIKDQSLARLQDARGVMPERQFREAQVAVREARVQLVNARQALGNLGLPPLDLASLRGLPDEQAAARVRTLGLPSELAQQEDVPGNLLPLSAPFEGTIIRRDLVVGEMTGPERTGFIVADVGKVWILLDVRLEDVDRLALRQTVTFDAGQGHQAEGVLQWISSEVDPKTRTIRVRAEAKNPTGQLRPATFGKARIHVQRDDAALTVPVSSVQWDGQARRVFLRRDEKTYEPRIVLPGVTAAGRVELLDPRIVLAAGLAAGLAARPPGMTPFATTTLARVVEEILSPLEVGARVATTGSHVLKSQMLESRIGGED